MQDSLIAQINDIWIQFVHQDLSIHISDIITILTIHHEIFLQFISCIIDISNPPAINQRILEHISSSSSCINTIFSYYETDGLPNFTLNEIDCLNHCRYGIINDKYKVYVEGKSALANKYGPVFGDTINTNMCPSHYSCTDELHRSVCIYFYASILCARIRAFWMLFVVIADLYIFYNCF